MKTLKIFFYTLLLTGSAAFAQYNNGYNNPYSVTRYGGVDRSIGNTDYNRQDKKATPEEIEKNRNERIDEFMVKLKDKLTLDELQVIAIKNELMTNSKNVEIVMKKEDIDKESKSEQVKAMADKTEAVIKSYLNKDQKEKYTVFIEDMKNGIKDKKSKKKEKEKEKTTEE